MFESSPAKDPALKPLIAGSRIRSTGPSSPSLSLSLSSPAPTPRRRVSPPQAGSPIYSSRPGTPPLGTTLHQREQRQLQRQAVDLQTVRNHDAQLELKVEANRRKIAENWKLITEMTGILAQLKSQRQRAAAMASGETTLVDDEEEEEECHGVLGMAAVKPLNVGLTRESGAPIAAGDC